MNHLSIDLETYSTEPIVKTGLYKYVQCKDFEILLFAYSVDGSPVEIVDLAQGVGGHSTAHVHFVGIILRMGSTHGTTCQANRQIVSKLTCSLHLRLINSF